MHYRYHAADSGKGFYELKTGECIWIKCCDEFHQTTVISEPFYNSDADEPGWKVETSSGIFDRYSIYVPTSISV